MSKGIGLFQQELLNNISNSPILENKLLWNLAEKSNNILWEEKINNLRFGQISKSFDNKFAASIKSLSERGLIISVKEKIFNFEEMVRLYPYKTKRYEVKYLRERLLPKFKKFINEHPFHVFSAPDIENHTLKILFKDKDSQKGYFNDWSKIETYAKDLFKQNEDFSDSILMIIFKGKSVFQPKRIKIQISFEELIKNLASNNNFTLKNPLFIKELTEFYNKYFHNESYKRNEFKNQLYSLVQIGKSYGNSFVLKTVKEYLYQKDKEFISKLPQTKIRLPEPRKEGWMNIGDEENEYSPILNKIIDRHVLKEFKFIYKN
jgi:hypothetical protein